MKRSLLLSIVLSIVLGWTLPAAADSEWIDLGTSQAAAPIISLLESNGLTITLEFASSGFTQRTVKIDGKPHRVISMPGGTPLLAAGWPDLPKVRKSMIIPGDVHMAFRILSIEEVVLDTIAVAPSKGNLSRDIDPDKVPYSFDEFYKSDDFYPAAPVEIGDPYIIRDYRGLSVQFNPVRYNPATGKIHVCTNLVVELYADGPGLMNVKEGTAQAAPSGDFRKIYENHFMNFAVAKYDAVPEPGNLVIITHDAFYANVLPLYEWKLQRGIPAELVLFSTIGSTSGQLQAYIQSLYDSPEGITYIILVGDAAQIPTLYGTVEGAACDACYTKLEGSDHYPDAFISRLSGQSAAHIDVQVAKVLNYEKYPDTGVDAAWYHKGTGIASSESGGTGIPDYERVGWLRDDLLGYNYTEIDEIYDPGASASAVTAALNEGRSILNYMGHGSGTSWSTTGFSNSTVNALSNTDKLPFICDVACLNASFVNLEPCFAEAWLRAGTAGAPTGAIGMYASSVSCSWVPPTIMQAEVTDLLVNDQRQTLGGLSFNGVMETLDQYPGNEGIAVMEEYNLFGDCTLMIRTDVPAEMLVSHNPTLFIGASSFAVNVTGVGGALASLYMYGVNYGYAYTDGSGAATITLSEPLEIPGDMTLTVTGYNKVPYTATIEVIPPEGPYVVYDAYAIDDTAGNGDGTVDFGESIGLDISLENVGIETALGVYAVLSTTDSYVTIVDDTHTYGDIAADAIASSGLSYQFSVDLDIPDGYYIPFAMDIYSSVDDQWQGTFGIPVEAPSMDVYGTDIDDATGNGIADPGETVDLIVTLQNSGSAGLTVVNGTLSTSDPYITIGDGSAGFGDYPSGMISDNTLDPFTFSADGGTPLSHEATFSLDLTSNEGRTASFEFSILIGHPEFLVIDVDTNHASAQIIVDLLEDMGKAVDLATGFSGDYDGYQTVFICLGTYGFKGKTSDDRDKDGRNHVLIEADAAPLAAFLDDGGNVYMEGGDTWAFDGATSLHAKFNIDGLQDGSGDTGTIVGQADTITEGMSFSYAGNNSFMDRIAATGSAQLIFQNQSPVYGNGVAHDAGVYKTVGFGFEFGGLTDSGSPNTKLELLGRILTYFDSEIDCDVDGDGWLNPACGGTDCDDSDAAVNPDAVEVCDDAIDNDCDGAIDMFDDDCDVPCTDNDEDGYAVDGGECGPIDCDDANPAVNPGVVESKDAGNCEDGIDNDCDGLVDAGDDGCGDCFIVTIGL